MSDIPSINKQIHDDILQDLRTTRQWSITLIITGLAIQIFHFLATLPPGFTIMLYLTGIILVGAGILFMMGSSTVPRNSNDILKRLQFIMLNKDPKRRLWAAQRYVGYMRDANLTKEQIISITHYLTSVIRDPPVSAKFKPYVSVDHIVVIREMAVQVPMNKHLRKKFVTIIKPLRKIGFLPEDAMTVLNDAIGYHPQKLPVQAYTDLMKDI